MLTRHLYIQCSFLCCGSIKLARDRVEALVMDREALRGEIAMKEDGLRSMKKEMEKLREENQEGTEACHTHQLVHC